MAAAFPNSNAPMPANSLPRPPRNTGRTCTADRPALADARSAYVTHGREHRDRREKPRHDREQHRRTQSDERDRAGSRAAARRSPPRLSAARSNPYARPYASGETTSARIALRLGPRTPRAAQAPVRNTATCHGAVANPMLLDRTAVVTYPPTATLERRVGIVGERATGELRDTGRPVGDALDQPERRGRRAERRREEARQQRRRDLVPHVGEEARQPDRPHARVEPGWFRSQIGRFRTLHRRSIS